jgi:hypothetical protein
VTALIATTRMILRAARAGVRNIARNFPNQRLAR